MGVNEFAAKAVEFGRENQADYVAGIGAEKCRCVRLYRVRRRSRAGSKGNYRKSAEKDKKKINKNLSYERDARSASAPSF